MTPVGRLVLILAIAISVLFAVREPQVYVPGSGVVFCAVFAFGVLTDRQVMKEGGLVFVSMAFIALLWPAILIGGVFAIAYYAWTHRPRSS